MSKLQKMITVQIDYTPEEFAALRTAAGTKEIVDHIHDASLEPSEEETP